MAQSLPENHYPQGSRRFDAYKRCLELERSAESTTDEGSGPKLSPQMCGRILGYMMREAPSKEGCYNVQKEIALCGNDQKLRELAEFYGTRLLHLFKKAGGSTPASSNQPSRPSFDDAQQTIQELMEEATRSNSALQKLALTRDNHRCVVAGVYDLKTFQKQLAANPKLLPPSRPDFTQVAHIFPDSSNQGLVWVDGLPGKKRQYSASPWAVVEEFGKVNFSSESFNGPSIHRVENVLTMCSTAHQLFDTLQLWFEATDIPNTYNLCSNMEGNFFAFFPPIPRRVTFKSTDPAIPLPNGDYLRIHAACARVAHLSGAAEYLQTILDELEERPVLASDGGSADMLSFLLGRAAVAAH